MVGCLYIHGQNESERVEEGFVVTGQFTMGATLQRLKFVLPLQKSSTSSCLQ